MILVWNDAKSFQRHIEAMRTFRLSHRVYPSDVSLLRDMPSAYEADLAHGERPLTCLTDSRGKLIFVPIWKIAESPGSQN